MWDGQFSAESSPKSSARMEYRGIPIDKEIWSQLHDTATWDRIRKELIPRSTLPTASMSVARSRSACSRPISREKAYPGSGTLAVDWICGKRLSARWLGLSAGCSTSRAAPYARKTAPDRASRWCRWQKSHGVVAGRSKTSRTQPSASKFLFGPSCWLRSLMRPEPGQSLAYVDWSAMEFGIAAAFSRDPA